MRALPFLYVGTILPSRHWLLNGCVCARIDVSHPQQLLKLFLEKTEGVPDDGINLLFELLQYKPSSRIMPDAAQHHSYCSQVCRQPATAAINALCCRLASLASTGGC